MKTVEELAREAGAGVAEFGLNCTKGFKFYNMADLSRFRDLVLEEAAKACDEVKERYPTDIFPDGTSVTAQSAKMARITADNCAAVIRAMKEQK